VGGRVGWGLDPFFFAPMVRKFTRSVIRLLFRFDELKYKQGSRFEIIFFHVSCVLFLCKSRVTKQVLFHHLAMVKIPRYLIMFVKQIGQAM
jgi:hypothetical protein